MKNVKCCEKRRQGGEEGRRTRKIREDGRLGEDGGNWGGGEGRKGKEMRPECRRCRTRYRCSRSL